MKHSERLRHRPALEALEGRQLLAAPITEFPIPAGAAGITAGPDGNLWFTLFDNEIGRITPTGQVTVFPVPPSASPPSRITAGLDGNLWFTYILFDHQIGRITPTGQVTVFPTPSGNHSSEPYDIVAGPDGNLWFTEQSGDKIGRITPAGQVTEFPVSISPGDIKAGPDGNLWFTETGPGLSMIGRITPSGQITEFPLRGILLSIGMAFGPDDDLWFTERVPETTTSGMIAGPTRRVEVLSSITTAGQITEIPLSGFTAGYEMSYGPDGNLWYAANINAIGRITPTGLAAQFSIPTAGGTPSGIVIGPDGNLWFSESEAANIGRFRVSTTDLRLAISTSTVTGTVGQPLTYTISVTNDSPFEATDVVLTGNEEIPPSTVPLPVSPTRDTSSISASQGTVKQLAGGGFAADLGNVPSGATATLTIVATFSSPRTITSKLAVHANESDTNPGDDFATVSTIISKASSNSSQVSNPPHVLSLHSIRVKRKGLTAVVVNFDQPMDPGHVSNMGIYHLIIVGTGKKSHAKVVGLSRASYDTASRSVRLSLKKPVKTGTLRLTIDHAGILAASGIGLAGGDYVASVPK
jgi:uncharacterized repeat protein (TIGR01451 family)